MIRNILIILATLICVTALGQKRATNEKSGADEIVRLWDNSTAPHSNFQTKDEVFTNKFSNTSSLDLYIYKADKEKNNGKCIVFFPGGSYKTVSFPKRIAENFAKEGITTVIVKYRCPNNGYYWVSLEDAIESLRYIRENSERLDINPEKIGVAGSSAGGHLAAWVSNKAPEELRPKYCILFYGAVVRGTWWAGQGGTIAQGGKDITPVTMEKLVCVDMVNENTPPTILFHSDDDDNVPPLSPTEYYIALKQYGIKASLHMYPSGGHGWSGRARDRFKYYDEWHAALYDWLEQF